MIKILRSVTEGIRVTESTHRRRAGFGKMTFQTMTIKEVQYIKKQASLFFSYKVLLNQIFFLNVFKCFYNRIHNKGWHLFEGHSKMDRSVVFQVSRSTSGGTCFGAGFRAEVAALGRENCKAVAPKIAPQPWGSGLLCPHKSISVADFSSSKGAMKDTSAPNTFVIGKLSGF